MAERGKNTRDLLILEGIREINDHGVTDFSVRRVAQNCGISCAAPYKHFKDKQAFIRAVIQHVNAQWRVRQKQVIEACGDDLDRQLLEMSVAYVCFLMEKPLYRAILMLKDDGYDNLYHKLEGQTTSRAQQLEEAYFARSGMSREVWQRKRHMVRALIFGTVFLCDAGELSFNEETVHNLRYMLEREIHLP